MLFQDFIRIAENTRAVEVRPSVVVKVSKEKTDIARLTAELVEYLAQFFRGDFSSEVKAKHIIGQMIYHREQKSLLACLLKQFYSLLSSQVEELTKKGTEEMRLEALGQIIMTTENYLQPFDTITHLSPFFTLRDLLSAELYQKLPMKQLIISTLTEDNPHTLAMIKWLAKQKNLQKNLVDSLHQQVPGILSSMVPEKEKIVEFSLQYLATISLRLEKSFPELFPIYLKYIRKVFISNQIGRLISNELTALLDETSESLAFVYDCLDKNGEEYVKFSEFYHSYITAKLKEYGLSSNTIDKIYEIYQVQKSKVISGYFKDDYVLKTELNRAYEAINRENPDRAADLLSRYVSEQLSQKKSADELSEQIENVLILFGHLSAKDMFMSLYNQRLVRRLVAERYSGLDTEKKMIEKFKQYAGEFFVHSSEALISQFEKSVTTMEAFEVMFKRRRGKQSEVDAQSVKLFVFPSHVWPFPHFVSIEEYLPAEVACL